jgi:hypothetical protein
VVEDSASVERDAVGEDGGLAWGGEDTPGGKCVEREERIPRVDGS